MCPIQPCLGSVSGVLPYHWGCVHLTFLLRKPAALLSEPTSSVPLTETETFLVRLRGVGFSYGDRPILQDLSLDVPRGKVTAIMGASGGGKTTVLRLISGQYRAQLGQVLVADQDVGKLDSRSLFDLRRRMGMLFQFGALFTDMTVFDNVAFPLREHTTLQENFIRSIVLMKLNAVGLRGARDLYPSQISGGMAKRVALARGIALDPELMMYDEPFAGLDPISLGTIAHLIREMNDALGMTSVVVSHDVNETFAIADKIVILAGGKIVAEGSPSEVRNSPDALVQQFITAKRDGPVPFHFNALGLNEDFALPISQAKGETTLLAPTSGSTHSRSPE